MAGASQRPAIRLIVNADDFGISERVNDGIVMATARDRHRHLPDGGGPCLRAGPCSGAVRSPPWM